MALKYDGHLTGWFLIEDIEAKVVAHLAVLDYRYKSFSRKL
jgi:hypothetical protein